MICEHGPRCYSVSHVASSLATRDLKPGNFCPMSTFDRFSPEVLLQGNTQPCIALLKTKKDTNKRLVFIFKLSKYKYMYAIIKVKSHDSLLQLSWKEIA